MMDFGAPLPPTAETPPLAQTQGGQDPYAGMSDSEVVTANTSGMVDGVPHIGISKMNDATTAALAKQFREEGAKGTKDVEAPQDFGAPALTKDFTNDQILSTLGYSGEDITKLKGDPAYKALAHMEGENFLAKDIQEPGKLQDAMRKIPSIGAFLHGADQSMFGVAQLLTHTAHAIGAVPETTPALFDALAKFNEANYLQNSGTKAGEYTVPKILGGVGAALATGGLAAAGAKAAPTAATLAAKAAAAPASALVSGVRLAKSLGVASGSGAVGAAAMTPTTNAPSEISEHARNEYWKFKGEDAKSGALWTLGIHGLMKTMFKAGLHAKNKIEVAAKIKDILAKARAIGPQGSSEYKALLDQLEPLFNNPEYAERELNFAQQGYSPTLGDVTQTGFTQKTERAARSMPFGIGKFRHGTQQPELIAAAQRITNEAFDRMINTKWGGRVELEKAAKGTDRHAEDAKRVLELMDNAGTDASKILQAGGKAENIRKLLIKEKLYKARDDLAGRAAVDPKLPLEEATKIMKTISHASVPNKGFMADVGAYIKALSDPVMPKNYASFTNDIHNVESLIKKYGVDTHEGQLLLDLKKAYQKTLKDFTDNVHKYAKAERFNITTRDTKPAFVNSAGGGGGGGYTFGPRTMKEISKDGLKTGSPTPVPGTSHQFESIIPSGEPIEEGVQRYVIRKPNLLRHGPETPEPRTIKLKSPIIAEGGEGLAQLKKKAGVPDDASVEEVEQRLVQYAKGQGHDGIVFTTDGVPRQIIDMTKWKKAIGDAEARAAKFYKETYRPAIDSGTVQAMRTSTPDEIFNQFIQKGKENRAQNFFDSLDAKGRASIQYELIKRATAAGTNADGEINPGKVADYLFKNKEAAGVFFKGEQKWALDGFLKLMQHAREASPSIHGGGHGAMSGFFVADAFLDVVRGVAEGHAGKALKGAVTSAAGLTGAGKLLAKLTTTPQLRHYMLAASDAAPGSPKMDKIYQKFSTALSLLMEKSVGETSGEKND